MNSAHWSLIIWAFSLLVASRVILMKDSVPEGLIRTQLPSSICNSDTVYTIYINHIVQENMQFFFNTFHYWFFLEVFTVHLIPYGGITWNCIKLF